MTKPTTTKPSTNQRLTASMVLDIRNHSENKVSDAALSHIFSVTKTTIRNIVERKTWNRIPAPSKVRGFRGYSIYPDGRVFSPKGKLMTQYPRKAGPVVVIKNAKGKFGRVPVSTLLAKAFPTS